MVAEAPVQQVSVQPVGLHADANPVGECSFSRKTAQEAECSKKTVQEAESRNKTVQEAESQEDGRAAENALLSPSAESF